MKKIVILFFGTLLLSTNLFAQITVNYTINTGVDVKPISPYIYGCNGDLLGNENFSSFRVGGNRLTGYNWENNFSNAGNDYQHSSDNYLVSSLSASQQSVPGVIALNLVDSNSTKYKLFTLPMAGYVSRDGKGTVQTSEAAPSGRWRQVVNKKGSTFTLSPDTSDSYVYVDEFLNYMNTKRGKSNAGGINAYLMDNEPDLWSSTHPRIHSNAVGAAELVNKTIALAKTVKDMDAKAEVFGYESYGFSGYNSLQSAPDWSSVQGSAQWYIDYYLSNMNSASTSDGRRLLDVLSLHWYSEATGDNRIINSNATTSNDNIARMQAPRTLWDSSYTENSWIAQSFSSYLPLIPRIMKSINQNYSGTKLAFTEYNYGDFNHISSGIAQADVLGIFGKYGVYDANYWNLQNNINYISAGFKIFRNYDGKNSMFGNTNVYSKMSDKQNSSVYTSIIGTSDSVLTMVVINKNLTNSINGQFAITSGTSYSTADVWGFDANSAAITTRSGISTITGNNFNYTIPPLCVLFFKIKANNVVSVSTPTITSTTPGSRCGAGTLTLSATASSGSISWYANSVGGTALAIGTSYTTTAISSTTTYYVDATNGSTTSSRTAVTATILIVPTASISGNTTVCSGASSIINIALTGATPWSFTYGSTTGSHSISGITSSTYTTSVTAGTYTLSIVSDASNCTGTVSGSSVITERTPITVSTATVTCNGNNTSYVLEFDIAGGNSASYTVNGGSSGISGNHYTGSPIASGSSYSLTFNDSYNCSPLTISGTKTCPTNTIVCNATASISGIKTICQGEVATVSISLNNGTPNWSITYAVGGVSQTAVTATSSPFTFTTSTGGAYTLVSVVDANSCSAANSGSATITVNNPPTVGATVSPSATVCAGKSIILSGTGALTYTWSGGNVVQEPNSFIPASTATYTVIGTDANNCSNSSTKTIIVNNLPIVGATVSLSATICAGKSITLSGIGALTYTWSGGNVVQEPNSFIPASTATYTVIGTDANNCSNSSTKTIIVNNLPIIGATVSPSATVCAGKSIILSGTGALTYTWSGGNVVQEPNSFIPTYTATYTVIGTDVNNCSNTTTQKVTVNSCFNVGIIEYLKIEELNIFPNPSNGIFDIIIRNATFDQIQISIVDLTGKEIFNIKEKNYSGEYKKQINLGDISEGVYFVKIYSDTIVKTKKLIIQ